MRTGITIWLGLLVLGTGAQAQGIDCGKARGSTEKAICTNPALMALDHSIAVAYAGALAQHSDRAAGLRLDLLRWLHERDAACAVPATQLIQCLNRQLNARLAALTPVAADLPVPTPPLPLPEATVPSQANPPPAEASLDATALPAAAEADTKLRVTRAGRFAIALHSKSGAALQFVDMLTGPSGISGEAGAQDGRLDLLLDQGIYKLRAFSAPGASGEVGVSVSAFRDAAPPRALPPPGRLFSAELHDLEQRAFWLAVPPSSGSGGTTTGEVSIEAAGRSLADLRLWRHGAELTDLQPEVRTVTPSSGHPMADLRLAGRVPAGTYLVTAYGGPALPWADGSTAQPFHLRAGSAGALAEGWVDGRIGPLGSEVFSAPAAASLLVLELPQAAPAELHADGGIETITAASRTPRAILPTGPSPADPSPTGPVEIRGAEGQPFRLRAIEPPGGRDFARPGDWWVSAVVAGAGGDEVPPAVLLERREGQAPARIVAAVLPRLAAGAPWRQRFNLRGATTLLFENSYSGQLQVRGGAAPIGLIRPAMLQENLPSGYLGLRLEPPPGAQGVVDLVVGPPGPAPAPAAPWPADPVLPLGVQTLLPGQRLHLYAGEAPGVVTGLSLRAVPVALAEGPLTVTQRAGVAVQVPVLLAPAGNLGATAIGGGEVAVTLAATSTPGGWIATLPAPSQARTVVLSRRVPAAPPADIPPPPPAGTATPLRAGAPVYFDLATNSPRSFVLGVDEGGLYRLETLGRLRTQGRIATPFIADLDHAEANGIGQNMLIQRWLRAGRYRVDVAAEESAGHAGLTATPAPLLAGATLYPGGSVRARLPAGTGVAFPVAVAESGRRYHLDLLGLGRTFTVRLDDAEGWPVTPPSATDALDVTLQPGTYRLLLSPPAVATRVVARLDAVAAAPVITGHGPHRLAFDTTAQATWREPAWRDAPRTPDNWTFALAGAATVTIAIGDGMVADLYADDGPPDRSPPDRSLARITGRYDGTLPAGRYRIEATSLGRNDRLDYTLRLDSQELQPDRPRLVSLPAHVPFAIARARVVSLVSFGRVPVRAVLRRADGGVLARQGAREDDWNIAVSRLLPAGAYVLDLAAAVPAGNAVPVETPDQRPAPSQDAEAPDSEAPADMPDDASDHAEEAGKQQVELRLSLPEARPEAAAPSQATPLEGGGVHVLTLPQPPPGRLLTAAASGSSESVLTLERQEAAGQWQVVALDQGRTPLVAVPVDGRPDAWRAELWPVDGGREPIRFAARALDTAATAPGQTRLDPVAGLPVPLVMTRLGLSSPGVVTLAPVPDGLLAGGWPGHALAPVLGRPGQPGMAIPQGTELWLLSRGSAAELATEPLHSAADRPIALTLPAGAQAVLPADPPDSGSLRVWLAGSGLGQPGLEAGHGMGAAPGSALALGAAAPVIRNAGSDEALPLVVTRLDLRLLPAQTPPQPLSLMLDGHTALPVLLPGGSKRLQADLAAGTAAIAGWQGDDTLTVWAGATPISRVAEGEWTGALLLNTGSSAAPITLSWLPASPEAPLRPGAVTKRFFGAAGTFDTKLEAGSGARLVLAGNADATVLLADGQVRRGRSVALSGPGRAIIAHGPGPLAAWIEADGQSPWPRVAAQPVGLPARLPLAGPAMAFSLALEAPALLHATTTAPVLLALAQGDRPATPALFPAGAEFHRALAAGPAELRLYSPHDGPLAGTLELAAQPVTPVTEGLGPTVAVAPGGSAVFGFRLAKAATIGLGVRTDPDDADVRVLDAAGNLLGEGVAQLRTLPAGSYLLEARVPPAATTTLLRPTVIGITPRGAGPPPEVARHYLELVGLAPQGDAQ